MDHLEAKITGIMRNYCNGNTSEEIVALFTKILHNLEIPVQLISPRQPPGGITYQDRRMKKKTRRKECVDFHKKHGPLP